MKGLTLVFGLFCLLFLTCLQIGRGYTFGHMSSMAKRFNKFKGMRVSEPILPWEFVGIAYQGKDIVFRLNIKYNNLRILVWVET